jgi:hypothetical protein
MLRESKQKSLVFGQETASGLTSKFNKATLEEKWMVSESG